MVSQSSVHSWLTHVCNQDHANRSMWYIKADQKAEERSIVHSWIHELRDFSFPPSDLLYPPHLVHVLSLCTMGRSFSKSTPELSSHMHPEGMHS